MIITNLDNLFDQMLREMEQFEKEHPSISPRHIVEEMKKRVENKFVVMRKDDSDAIQKLNIAIQEFNEYNKKGW